MVFSLTIHPFPFHVKILLYVFTASYCFPNAAHLKYPWNIFGICSNHITLCNRSHVEHFAATNSSTTDNQI